MLLISNKRIQVEQNIEIICSVQNYKLFHCYEWWNIHCA